MGTIIFIDSHSFASSLGRYPQAMGPEEAGGDDEALDLAGAFIDLGNALVAPTSLDVIVTAVSEGAVDL
jgi:hypothetical protein